MSTRPAPNPFERWLRGWRAALVLTVFWTFVGVMGFLYQYLDVFVRGGSEPFHEKFIEEMTGAYGAGVGFVALVWFIRRLTTRRYSPVAVVGLHLLALPVYSVFHTAWNWVTRVGAFAGLGLGAYDYGIMWIRFFMEFPRDVLDYTVMAALVHLVIAYRAARDRELHVEQLRTQLKAAQLESLAAQLRPHFLFNALNTVSAVMYRDVGEADRMLRLLGDLLRRSLRNGTDQLVPLAEEIETLELYLEVMRARFGDRLRVDVDVTEGAGRVAVPPLVLQPLVENALEHGAPGPEREVRVCVTARREGERLRVTIEDNGRGPASDGRSGHGVGLVNTRARLDRLFGDDHELRVEPGRDGGCRVTLIVPVEVRSAA